MINKLWIGLIVLGSSCLLLTGKSDVLNTQILSSGKATLELVMQIFPLMSLWLGIMNIAKESGLLLKLSKFIYPLLHRIFPEIPRNHEAFGFISSNILSNMFGLGNAATPFGLKAMESLQKLNKNKEVASRSMITFLVINTCGLCIIPTTIISLRILYGSDDPSFIAVPCLIISFLSLLFGLFIDRMLSRRNHK